MTAEQTQEEKRRAQRYCCLACGALITVGMNYPPGVPIPWAMELWCTNCHVISLVYQAPRK